ncbi:MAG: MEDS domain-containing protein [Armatimonadota bacterium]|nr:MEDS domain-containing protein [Armatimonadota bacterium]
MNDGSLRKSGIDLIGDVEWGTHFCQFYATKEDLIDILVPYFAAGLANNEFCMWVTAEHLDEKEATAALRKVVPDLDSRIENGQIEIIPHTQWYLLGGSFEQNRVLNGWVAKLNDAMSRGFDGLRLTGNTFWLEKSDWRDFADCEAAVNEVIGNYRIVAICTYSLEKCNASEIADVVVNHQFALMKREGEWTIIESSDYKQAREALRLTEQRYQTLFTSIGEAFALHEIIRDENGKPRDYRFLEVNPAFEAQTGLTDVVGKTMREIFPGIEPKWIDTYSRVASTGEPVHFQDYAETLGRHFEVHAFSPAPGRFAVIFMDVTKRVQAEEKLEAANEELAASNEELEATNEELRVTTDELHVEVKHRRQAEEALHKESRRISYANRILELFAQETGNDLYDKVLDIVLEATESKHGVFGYIDDKGNLVCPTMSKLFNQCDMDGEHKCICYTREEWTGLWSRALLEGRILYTNEPPAVPRGHVPISRNMAAPILLQDEVIGLINLANKDTDYTEEDREFIGAVTNSIAPLLYTWVQRGLREQERKAAEDALRASARRLNRSQEIAHLGSWELDLLNNHLYWSDEVYRIFGLKPQEFGATYEAFLEAVHPDDRAAVDAAYSGSLREGRDTYEIEHRVVRQSEGKIRVVHERCEHIRDKSGRIILSVGMVHDVTERKQAERELAQARARAEELYEREHHIAEILQKALIPDTKYNVSGCDIAVKYEAALDEAEVGGDFYDVFDLGDGKVGVLIGDVAGKGLAAAIRVAAARHSIRSYAFLDPRPSRVMARANDALCRDGSDMTNMLTAFFAVVDTRVGVVTYANGGHESPLIRTAGGKIEELDLQGRALGAMSGWDYSEDTRLLGPGDVLVMVTDGVTEARPDSRTLFGLKGVKSHLQQFGNGSVERIAAGILEAAKEHAGGKLKDDAAIVALSLKTIRQAGKK